MEPRRNIRHARRPRARGGACFEQCGEFEVPINIAASSL